MLKNEYNSENTDGGNNGLLIGLIVTITILVLTVLVLIYVYFIGNNTPTVEEEKTSN